jgi:opacity protein-like surface antigen
MFAQSPVVTVALALSLLAPSIATAQSSLSSQGSDRPTLVLFANGGGASALTNLDDAGTSSTKTGWTAGGGAGVQLNRYVALRGTFDYAQADGDNTSPFAGQSLRRYFYGGDVQLRYPTASGFAPYLLVGAGAVTIDDKDNPAFNRFTKFAGKGGLGAEYTLPRSDFAIYAQANSYVYKFDRNGFDKTQVDLLWTGGVSYRLPH